MTRSPRITPGRFKDLGPINWAITRVVAKVGRVDDAHLFSTLARTGLQFTGWLHYSSTLMPGGKLSRLDTELTILRVAHLRTCDYEMDHHIRISRHVGVTREMLEQVRQGPTDPAWSDRHRALLTAVDQLVQTKDLDDVGWKALAEHYTERELVEFCLIVTQYDGLATTIGVLGIERDFDR
ncbi:carboxymuconolactone decarboxylase family protein [Antrihabitans cavernicola]|uniref:Carboxymuconolactone decarboxylase family protein n=1 Tax=Antrihabitans cavernicola TaxID=2495913 RepID=A0A5A7S9T7_9NOCA|nr:carboxymuconolactone decarboxylase family protein [Spelaeibacter cavernicola]KAA0022244.1 carboxymuconolactone decarboxylase family protein [Spelaeibacter cavernicola]